MTTSAKTRLFVLMILAALTFVGCSDIEHQDATTIYRDTIMTSLGAFRADVGRFPTTEEGLAALIRDPGINGWRGPYVSADVAKRLDQYTYVYSDLGPQVELKSIRKPS